MLLCAVAALAGYDRRSLLKHDRGREAVEGGRQRVWTFTMALRGGDAVSEPDNVQFLLPYYYRSLSFGTFVLQNLCSEDKCTCPGVCCCLVGGVFEY